MLAQVQYRLIFLPSGHPIINDPFYNSAAFGPERGKGGVYGQSIEKVLIGICVFKLGNTYLTWRGGGLCFFGGKKQFLSANLIEKKSSVSEVHVGRKKNSIST